MMCFNGFPIASLNATKSDIVAKRLLLCISSTLIALFVASMLQYEWYVFSVVHIIILGLQPIGCWKVTCAQVIDRICDWLWETPHVCIK